MKKINTLMLIIFPQILLASTAFALTPKECDQTGGACVCVAFPGAEPICTRSSQTSLAHEGKKKNKNYIYLGFE